VTIQLLVFLPQSFFYLIVASSSSCSSPHALSSSACYAAHRPLHCPLPVFAVTCSCVIRDEFMLVMVCLPYPQPPPLFPPATQSWQSVASPLIVAFVVCCPFPRGNAAEACVAQMITSIYNVNHRDEVCTLKQWQKDASKAALFQQQRFLTFMMSSLLLSSMERGCYGKELDSNTKSSIFLL
jgi:hypothetical protein